MVTRELISFNTKADEFLKAARLLGGNPNTVLEIDLEMLEAVIKLEVSRALKKERSKNG